MNEQRSLNTQKLTDLIGSVTNNHPMNQLGKGIEIGNGYEYGTALIVKGEQQIEVPAFKIVATWINPKYPHKPTNAYPVKMIIDTYAKQGIRINDQLQAIRIKTRSIYKKCRELIVYDNTNNSKFPIMAYWQDGYWLEVDHPLSRRFSNPKPITSA